MKNWQIPLMVVTLVAFMQTYEAASTVLAEERRPPERWQVKTLFWMKSWRMTSRNIGVNRVNVNPLWFEDMKLLTWQICEHICFHLGFFLAELTGAFFSNFTLSEWVGGGGLEQPDGKSDEKSQSPSILWAHGKTFRYGKAHLWQSKHELISAASVASSGLKKPLQVIRRE